MALTKTAIGNARGKARRTLYSTILICVFISLGAQAQEGSNGPATALQPPSDEKFPFQPFTASYRGEAYGMSLENLGTRSLKSTGENRYRVEYDAKAMVYSMVETSDFIWKDNRIVPLAYNSSRGTVFSKRKAQLLFDWDAMTADYKVRDRSGQFEISPGVQDPITSALVLALKLENEAEAITVAEAKKDNVKTRKFERIDTPELETPLGSIKTIHLKLVDDDPERQTEIWVHQQYPFIPVKLRQNDEGDVFLLELTGLKLNQ